MPLIAWSSMLSTGISEQDNQHKKLIDLINQLHAAMQSGKGAEMIAIVLSELVNYSVYHFGYEEKLMAKHKYEDSPTHKTEHTKFIQSISELKKKFDSGKAVSVVEFMNFLRGWLTEHIMKSDKKLAQALNKSVFKKEFRVCERRVKERRDHGRDQRTYAKFANQPFHESRI